MATSVDAILLDDDPDSSPRTEGRVFEPDANLAFEISRSVSYESPGPTGVSTEKSRLSR